MGGPGNALAPLRGLGEAPGEVETWRRGQRARRPRGGRGGLAAGEREDLCASYTSAALCARRGSCRSQRPFCARALLSGPSARHGAARSERLWACARSARTKRGCGCGCGCGCGFSLPVVLAGCFSAAARFDTMLLLLAARAVRAGAPASKASSPRRACARSRERSRGTGRQWRPFRCARAGPLCLLLAPPEAGAVGSA